MPLFKIPKEKLTIKRKIILLGIITTLIPCLIIGAFTFQYVSNDVESKVSTTTSNMLSVINWNIDMVFVDVESSANMILATKDIQRFLTAIHPNAQTDIQLQTATRDVLINISNNKPYISAIYVGSPEREYLHVNQGESRIRGLIYDRLVTTKWYDTVKTMNGKGIWINSDEVQFINSDNLLLFGKKLRHLESLQDIGLLSISVDKGVFDHMFKSLEGIGSANIFILEQGKLVYANGNQEKLGPILTDDYWRDIAGDFSKNETVAFNGEKYIINATTNQNTGWKVVSLIPFEQVNNEIAKSRIVAVVLLLGSFVLAMIGAYLISNRFIKQFMLLNRVVLKTGEIPDVFFDERDEIGKIGNSFIRIVKSNHELNAKLLESKIKEKEAELIALQSHINPHFLYNTLNSIYLMAEQIKAKNIAKVAINLSKIFKLTLNHGEYITTVQNEMDQIKSYLEIQNIRFDQKIEYDIEIEPGIRSLPMLKLLLQPLVENAVHHGLELLMNKGKIRITGRAEEDSKALVFEVIDNGVGFDTLDPSAHKEGYALKNIQERIKLQYGDDYGLMIESSKGHGTRVVLRIGLHA